MSRLSPIGEGFIQLSSVESTNNYAMARVRAGMAHHGEVIYTEDQTKGKGQREKGWISEKGKNIALSAIVDPAQITGHPFSLSMAAGLAARDLFKTAIDDEVTVKWPNDVYWRDRKAAGILIENSWQGQQWKFAVIGIGINVNQRNFEGLEKKAVSLLQITGEEFSLIDLAQSLCHHLDIRFRQLISDPSTINEEYQKSLFKLGEIVSLRQGTRKFNATLKGVSHEGELIVQHELEERFAVGEVQLEII